MTEINQLAERIYIAGPYSASNPDAVIVNVFEAIWAGVEIHQRGHVPFIPHLYYYMDEVARAMQEKITYQEYLDMDIVWLRQCTSLLYLAKSPGADKEIKIAESLRMKIYYTINEIPKLVRGKI